MKVKKPAGLICYILLLLLLPLFAKAQLVIIKGTALGAEGKKIQLLAYSDQITYTEKKLSSALIDSAGKFVLSYPASDTAYFFLKIDFYKAGIFLEPGKTYEIKVDSQDYSIINDKINPYLEPKILTYSFYEINKNDLNFLIQKFDEIYNDYLYNNAVAIYRLRDYKRIDTLRLITSRIFSYNKSSYFKNYMNYSIGLLELPFITDNNRSIVAEKYLMNYPLLYDNIRYMDFFNQFFTNFLLTNKFIKKQDLIQTINQNPDYGAVTDTLGKDSILRNELLREVVLLKSLFELSYNKEFNKNNIAYILLQLAKNSKFQKNRDIAWNMIRLFDKLQPETQAPSFSLPDVNKKTFHLSDLKGKYVYLSFWTSWCTSCNAEFIIMKKLYETYGNKIAFVSISADKEFITMANYVKNQKYNWHHLHFNNDYDLLDAYDIKTYPVFVFIDMQGKILSYPAPKPSENIATFLDYYSKKDTKNINKPLFPKPK